MDEKTVYGTYLEAFIATMGHCEVKPALGNKTFATLENTVAAMLGQADALATGSPCSNKSEVIARVKAKIE